MINQLGNLSCPSPRPSEEPHELPISHEPSNPGRPNTVAHSLQPNTIGLPEESLESPHTEPVNERPNHSKRLKHFLKTARIPLFLMALLSVTQAGPFLIGAVFFGLPAVYMVGPAVALGLTLLVGLAVRHKIRALTPQAGRVPFSNFTIGSFAPGLWGTTAICTVGAAVASAVAAPIVTIWGAAALTFGGMAALTSIALWIENKLGRRSP